MKLGYNRIVVFRVLLLTWALAICPTNTPREHHFIPNITRKESNPGAFKSPVA